MHHCWHFLCNNTLPQCLPFFLPLSTLGSDGLWSFEHWEGQEWNQIEWIILYYWPPFNQNVIFQTNIFSWCSNQTRLCDFSNIARCYELCYSKWKSNPWVLGWSDGSWWTKIWRKADWIGSQGWNHSCSDSKHHWMATTIQQNHHQRRMDQADEKTSKLLHASIQNCTKIWGSWNHFAGSGIKIPEEENHIDSFFRRRLWGIISIEESIGIIQKLFFKKKWNIKGFLLSSAWLQQSRLQ